MPDAVLNPVRAVSTQEAARPPPSSAMDEVPQGQRVREVKVTWQVFGTLNLNLDLSDSRESIFFLSIIGGNKTIKVTADFF